jgi:PAS domain S-box-containing protein
MRPRRKTPSAPAAHPTTRPVGHWVLLIEDNPVDEELCRRMLGDTDLAIRIETASSRAEAERHLRARPFDVVITDHGLPDGGAADIVRLVRAHDPEIPCIILTGVLDDRATASLLAQGAFDYVQKDRPARLAGAVHRALEARRVRNAAADTVRNIEGRQREIAVRLIRTLENMSDGFVALDHGSCYTYVNRRAAEMLGKSPEELLAQHAWTDFPEPGRLPLRRACERALAEQQPVVIEEPFLLSARWLESRIIPSPDGLAIFFHDVTARREAVDALQAGERRFRTVVESAASGMIMVDQTGKVLFVNRAVEQQFGYPRDELIGKSMELLVPKRFRGMHPAYRADFAAAPSARPMGAGRDLFGLHKDGHEIPVEIGLTPLDAEDGLSVLVTIVDITERKRGEVERDGLARRLIDLQESERRDLANELHDEIGQLLTGLKLMVEGRGTLGGADEMGQLVREALSRVRDVSMNLRPPMLDDLGLLPTLEWLVQRLKGHTGLGVRFTHSGLDRRFAPTIETAAFRIAQEALTNVARHAGVREAVLDVQATTEFLSLSIHDRGAGFAPTVATGAEATQGLRGMNERARLLGGTLRVESAPGGGTRVVAQLPAEAAPGHEPGP